MSSRKVREPCPLAARRSSNLYADNDTELLPTRQTDGKLLADRALSRLLKQDWPRSIDELTWS